MNHERPSEIAEREGLKMRLGEIARRAGAELEVVSGVPVITLAGKADASLASVVAAFGKESVFRVINAQFVGDALATGTDKARVDTRDHRKVGDWSGLDAWGVEKWAARNGYAKSDVFCGLPGEFLRDPADDLNSSGLGIPEDRSAVLVFDARKLVKIDGTDGYAFADPKKKRDALLGVVRFVEVPQSFEEAVRSAETMEQKIAVLEREILALETKQDLERAPYLAMHMIALLHEEGVDHRPEPGVGSAAAKRLKELSARLQHETSLIDTVTDLERQLEIVRSAFVGSDEGRKASVKTWPNFVIGEAARALRRRPLAEKFKRRLLAILEDAHACKREFRI